MKHPTFSVVIATKNREALLGDTLAALTAQQWPRDRFEILVADNGSTDNTRAVVTCAAKTSGAPRIVYRHVSSPGKSHAVNAIFKEAAGDIFALTDDDVCPEADWLPVYAAAFEETGADYAAGRILPQWEADPPPWLSEPLYGVLAIPDNGEQRLTLGPGGDGRGIIPVGANMAVRACVVKRIGGLRHDLGKLSGTLRTGEDHEFFLRMVAAGYHGVYEPRALVRHFVPRERLERSYFRRWLYQNGRDVSKLEAAHAAGVRRVLGVPRYLWRQAAADAMSMVRAGMSGDGRRRFAASTRLIWFGGYVRDSWCA